MGTQRIMGAIAGSIQTEILCVYCNKNDARLITEHGGLACAVCCEARKVDAIRVSDVPALLKLARNMVDSAERGGAWAKSERAEAFEAVIGRRPK